MVKIEKHLSHQRKSIQFMSGIVDQIHNLTVIDNDSPQVLLNTVELTPLIKSIIDGNEAQAQRKNITIKLNGASDIQFTTDEQVLGQAFENLLANSIKYSHESSDVTVNVKAGQETVLIQFVDKGVGMASDEIDLLFSRFGRLPSSRPTNNESSLGLGLYIAHKQIALLNGVLSATSSGLGHGSTFSVELPLR